MIPATRITAQQLTQPQFETPGQLIQWMGVMQAQEYSMMKWAVGIRLASGSLTQVNEALNRGEILRIHVMRPTWHLVAVEDIRWMTELNRSRLRPSILSWAKEKGVTPEFSSLVNRLLEKMLEGTSGMTKTEIMTELQYQGVTVDTPMMNCFLMLAKIEGVICSGIEKNGKPTYALLEERVAPTPALNREEALAKLTRRYFRSHSPATLQDFVWWSGLTLTQARKGITLIKQELNLEKFRDHQMYIHHSWNEITCCDKHLHLLPSYDEYLISYKDRTHVLPLEYYRKAFNPYGIFYPVIVCNGQVVGNWSRKKTKKGFALETSFFDSTFPFNKKLLQKAEKRYLSFLEI
ncbi:MAG: winged helix DNA-binding domain-containing protein [Bacteroides sp.]|nr:winged helix DNA-binding domain-containing protein [Bacteroides sp.]